MNEKDVLLDVRPSWLHFIFPHFLFFFLIIPVIIAVWKRYSLRFIVKKNKIIAKKGILKTTTSELAISDLKTINIEQGLIQKLFNIGNIALATAGTAAFEQAIYGLPSPDKIKETITKQKERIK